MAEINCVRCGALRPGPLVPCTHPLCDACAIIWRTEQAQAGQVEWRLWRSRQSLADYGKLVDEELADPTGKYRAPPVEVYFTERMRREYATEITTLRARLREGKRGRGRDELE